MTARKDNGFDPRVLRDEQRSLDRMLAWSNRRKLTDAESECVHGALPLDRSKPAGCRCWTPEATSALLQRVEDNPDYSDAA